MKSCFHIPNASVKACLPSGEDNERSMPKLQKQASSIGYNLKLGAYHQIKVSKATKTVK